MATLFKGEKSLKQVTAWGYNKQMLVQPGVATTELDMGVFVSLFEKDEPDKVVDAKLWGLVTPHDLLTCWRGMLILQEVKNLDEADLCNAYYAGQRDVHSSDQRGVDEIRGKIGSDRYNAIMSMPIPEEVISLIIKLTDDGEHVALWPITEEVEAGTLQWRDDFARIGAKHPQQVKDREEAEKRLIARYERYLEEYAKAHNLSLDAWGMNGIKGGIVNAVERGLEQTYGEDIVFGVAIAREHAGTAAFMGFMGFGVNEEHFNAEVEKGRQEAAEWVATHFKKGFWIFNQPLRTVQEYLRILTDIDTQWEQMPIISPLV
jgi:hypothetical protein